MNTPFYFHHGPNPGLSKFVQDHGKERPYDPHHDSYEIPPFRKSIHTTKQSPIYSLHGYHLGKKPHDAIREYIAHHTEKGDLVLDPFSGSGSTALAALLEHRKAVAIDASPAATFIARYYVAPIDPQDFANRFRSMVERVRDELDGLYQSTCHRCNGPALLHHVVYSNEYSCPVCKAVVTLFEATCKGSPPRCPRCRSRKRAGIISPNLGTVGFTPVAVSFSCLGGCKPRRTMRSICGTPIEVQAFERIDRKAIEALEAKPIPYLVPDIPMMNVQDEGIPWGDEWRPSRNFRRLRDLFTHRNLWALAALRDAARDDLDMQALLTSVMFAVSRKAQHLDGGGGYIPGNWALPPMSKQRNVLESLTKVFHRALRAREQLAHSGMGHDVCLSTQSATDMSAIPDNSVDYVFTDPPYGGAVQYAELNFLWEAWLGLDTGWHEREIVINRSRGFTGETWTSRMTSALSECHRVLKPGRWISICYHDVSKGTWSALQQAVQQSGFVTGAWDEVVAIDTGGRTYNQYTVDKAVKRDLVLSFRKPREGESRRTQPVGSSSFAFQLRPIIEEFLRSHPGSTKDRIYDHVVTRSMQAGAMQPHDFDRILRSVAVERGCTGHVVGTGVRKGAKTSRWYPR